MNQMIAIAPVRKSLTVKASQRRAFDVFTGGHATWWPIGHGIGPAPRKTTVFEQRLGGRWYELAEDGTETTVGKILVWEPPARFIVSWDINSQWKPDAAVSSEVEVRFIAESENVTRLELEHRKFETLGAEGGAKLRGDVDNGWPGLLELYRKAAEA